MRRSGPVKVIVYFPKNAEERRELETRAAQVHAESVLRRIEELGCPATQKAQLLDAIIDSARKRNIEKEVEKDGRKKEKKA